MPHVTVIIVNWQRAQDTIECVRSVQQSKHTDVRILVVDNGSQDNSVAQLRESLPGVTLLSLPENLGFSGGYNAGIREALKHDADFLFLLNNDTVIEPDTISQLLAAPWDVAIPKILYFDAPDTIWSTGAQWRRFPPSVKMIGPAKQTARTIKSLVHWIMPQGVRCSSKGRLQKPLEGLIRLTRTTWRTTTTSTGFEMPALAWDMFPKHGYFIKFHNL